MMIDTVEKLEEALSHPLQGDVEAMRALDGDILILGVGGKMGPSLAKLARRAAEACGTRKRIIGVARFSDDSLQRELQAAGIETIAMDLLGPDALYRLPDIRNVVFMAAKKFGTSSGEHETWAMNTYLPVVLRNGFTNRASWLFRPAMCIRCSRSAKVGQRKTRPSHRSANMRNPLLAGNACSNTPRLAGERRLPFSV
jgi:hypothetical protein